MKTFLLKIFLLFLCYDGELTLTKSLQPELAVESRLPAKSWNGIIKDLFSTLPYNHAECGQSGVVGNTVSGRIVNGKEVNPKHSLPYQAIVQTASKRGYAVCGGTIISEKYVLTAAHCVFNMLECSVEIGVHNVGLGAKRHQHEEKIKVSAMKVHEKFNPASQKNFMVYDIALLKLSRNIIFNAHVSPACLPTLSDDKYTYVGKNAIVSGWGANGTPYPVKTLMMATVKIVSPKDPKCFSFDKDKQICAYAKGIQVGAGDSGGPLVIKVRGRNTVIGITSHMLCSVGHNGQRNCDYPQIFTSVIGYLGWIVANMD